MTKNTMTFEQAAQILNTSANYVHVLVKDGLLDADPWLNPEQVWLFKEAMDQRREKLLDDLVRLTEEYDGYEF
jgi:hypothetical protein